MNFLILEAKVCGETVWCMASGSLLSGPNNTKGCVHRHQVLALAYTLCVCVCVCVYILTCIYNINTLRTGDADLRF